MNEQEQKSGQQEQSQVLQPDQQERSQVLQPAPIPAPIVGGGASDLRQMKEEAI